MVGAIVVALLANPLLSLFGRGFHDAAPALLLLAGAHVVNSWVAFNGTVLNVTGYQSYGARSAAIALVVDAGLLALLIPAAGVEGAAIAALADVTLRNVLNSRAVRSKLGLRTAAFALLPRGRPKPTLARPGQQTEVGNLPGAPGHMLD